MMKDSKNSGLTAFGILVLLNLSAIAVIFIKINRLEALLSNAVNNAASMSNQANPDLPGKRTSPIPVKTLGSPSMGSPNATVTIVEFSDFQCPFCKEVQPTLRKLFKEYDSKVRLVFRNYPISSIHPESTNAAIASLCANEQNKFWEYHDKLFEKASEENPLTKKLLEKTASELGLNRRAFDTCFDSKKYLAQVQKDIKDGASYGVDGTPTFFINNKIIFGNQPVETFKEIVDKELNKSK